MFLWVPIGSVANRKEGVAGVVVADGRAVNMQEKKGAREGGRVAIFSSPGAWKEEGGKNLYTQSVVVSSSSLYTYQERKEEKSMPRERRRKGKTGGGGEKQLQTPFGNEEEEKGRKGGKTLSSTHTFFCERIAKGITYYSTYGMPTRECM